MSCEHQAFDTFVAVEQTDSGRLATIELKCRSCGEPMRWVGLDPGRSDREPCCSADGTEARLPFEPSRGAGSTIRCPECDRLLFGQALDDAPGLDRPVAVADIVCGPEHVVHYADGVALVVAPDGVRVLGHDDGRH